MNRELLKISILSILFLGITNLACQSITRIFDGLDESMASTATPPPTLTPLPPVPFKPGELSPDEPVFITGAIPYTSPFFLNTLSEPFVMLEDQAGFVRRDKDFVFPLSGQVIGPVQVHDDETITYSLSLPAVPQGTLVNVANDDKEDVGVQLFAIAYWSNIWGDTFLEPRDGTGWSTAYASTVTDPDHDNEIVGGVLIVWTPDDQQRFPTGFGEDGLLFTEDDPTDPIPAGYSIVDLNEEPFRIYKESQPEIVLNEGVIGVNDYSDLSYTEAFEMMFQKVSLEYPFTEEKGIDWDALYQEFAPRFESARNKERFYLALRDFTYAIPDAHIGVSLDAEVFFNERGGSFGLVLTELSDGRVLVTQVLPGTPGEAAGIQVGAEILSWNEMPVSQAIAGVVPFFGPYSTDHHERLDQLIFLTRVPPNTRVEVDFRNPGTFQSETASLQAIIEYQSLFNAIPYFSIGELDLPVEAEILPSGLAYIKMTTFSDDYRLMARLWERHIERLIENQIPGLIIDLRINTGGSSSLAMDFAGYFFDEEITLSRRAYYNYVSNQFEYLEHPSRIRPAPQQYEGEIVVLVGPDCISACEGFAYALRHTGRGILVGHLPTAGAYGEVGRGQYKLPEDLTLQFPTGRTENLDGQLLIEGLGLQLDLIVPITEDAALGMVDVVLEEAVRVLLEMIE